MQVECSSSVSETATPLLLTSSNTQCTIWFVAALSLIVDVRTYVRTYVWTDGRTDGRTFLPGLLGHPRGDDLKSKTSLDLLEQEIVMHA